MNRPIKFRAWIGTKMEHNVMAGFLGAFYVQGMDPKDSACMSPFNTIYSEQTPVMQFTGLLDKNGKEIYEGDVVAVKFDVPYVERISWKGPPNAICEVYWDYSGFHLKAKGESDFRYSSFEDLLHEATFSDMLMMNTTESEVIGNIYENPDLLTP